MHVFAKCAFLTGLQCGSHRCRTRREPRRQQPARRGTWVQGDSAPQHYYMSGASSPALLPMPQGGASSLLPRAGSPSRQVLSMAALEGASGCMASGQRPIEVLVVRLAQPRACCGSCDSVCAHVESLPAGNLRMSAPVSVTSAMATISSPEQRSRADSSCCSSPVMRPDVLLLRDCHAGDVPVGVLCMWTERHEQHNSPCFVLWPTRRHAALLSCCKSPCGASSCGSRSRALLSAGHHAAAPGRLTHGHRCGHTYVLPY